LNFLVLQHIDCEPPAAYEDALRARGAVVHPVHPDRGETLLTWKGFDGILAMGGPMSANDEEQFPWLRAEKNLVCEAVRAGVPYWGVCLGAQLLAASLGARVFAGPKPEVGVLAVHGTDAASKDPVFRALPTDFVGLQWHGDTYDLPVGATQLARSAAFEQQAFVYGRAYGLQFHLEVDAELASRWADVAEYRSSLEAVEGEGAIDRLVRDVLTHEQVTNHLARRALTAWLDHVVTPFREAVDGTSNHVPPGYE
jgi:GMP synthase (glutamine-hydrolysing)